NRGEIFILRELELLVLLRTTSASEGHFEFVGAAYTLSDLETLPWVASDSPSGAITLILAWTAGNGHDAALELLLELFLYRECHCIVRSLLLDGRGSVRKDRKVTSLVAPGQNSPG